MKYARALEVLSLVLPLATVHCQKNEGTAEPNSPESETAGYAAPQTPERTTVEEPQPGEMTPASGVTESPRETIPPPEIMKPAELTDEQIAGITDAANTAEIDQAKLALSTSKNPRVKKFAQMMIDEHGKAQRDQAKLVSKLGITPAADSPKVTSLKKDASDTERTLKAATSELFDKTYIDIQVADHQMVLDSLDRDFIPSAKNPEFKRALEEFRPKVEHHLREATEIQKMLMSAKDSKDSKGSKAPAMNPTTNTDTL